jgi:hypothetical protein
LSDHVCTYLWWPLYLVLYVCTCLFTAQLTLFFCT